MKIILYTIAMAMVPVIELRGAIPFGTAGGLSIHEAMIYAIIGNLIPMPIILLFLRKVFQYMRATSGKLENIVVRLEERANSKKHIIEKYEWIGLVLLVAIPLPGTGAWTGALVAVVLDMRMRRALPAITIGVIIAGLLVSIFTYGGLKVIL
ncbi:COG2426 family protein [Eubacteriales bacterium KG127]